MGIYDRDYYRPERSSFSLRMPRTMVGMLILINVVIYVLCEVTSATPNGGRWLTNVMAVDAGSLLHPLEWWKLLSYGFAHSPRTFSHILFNMLALFFLGRDVEARYGSKEFLRIYLVAMVFSAVVWCLANEMQGEQALAIGASAAISAVVVLFALNFPHRQLLLFFVLPVPAWLVGIGVVIFDAMGAMKVAGAGNVAYVMHLAGAAFALAYFQFRWNLGRLVPSNFANLSWRSFKPKAKLRLHDPDRKDAELKRDLDRILDKIHREGSSSLNRKERRALENASREAQKRRGSGES